MGAFRRFSSCSVIPGLFTLLLFPVCFYAFMLCSRGLVEPQNECSGGHTLGYRNQIQGAEYFEVRPVIPHQLRTAQHRESHRAKGIKQLCAEAQERISASRTRGKTSPEDTIYYSGRHYQDTTPNRAIPEGMEKASQAEETVHQHLISSFAKKKKIWPALGFKRGSWGAHWYALWSKKWHRTGDHRGNNGNCRTSNLVDQDPLWQ